MKNEIYSEKVAVTNASDPRTQEAEQSGLSVSLGSAWSTQKVVGQPCCLESLYLTQTKKQKRKNFLFYFNGV